MEYKDNSNNHSYNTDADGQDNTHDSVENRWNQEHNIESNDDIESTEVQQNTNDSVQDEFGKPESIVASNSENEDFYDSTYSTSPNENPPYRNQQKQKKNWTSGFFGGIIGGLISAIVVTLLFTTGVLDSETNTANSGAPEAMEVDATPAMIETLSAEDANVATNIQEVSNAVVGVVNLQQQSIWTGSQEAGTGSGIIYKKENGKAYIVTNQHVVDGAQEVEVVLNDDERIPAKVLGEDSLTDLAVLEVDGEKINTVAKIGSSEDIMIGETVLAIGNPLGLEFANSVTKGIISGLNRSVTVDTNRDGQPDWVTEVLQTDAAINPGNSGGALVNGDGEVIGINSMKIAQDAVEGIGFAIPIDAAFPIIEQLENSGEVTRPQIGIYTVSLYQVPAQYRYEINLPKDIEGGMVIADVQANSPAANAGLQQFDVVTKINGNQVTSILELRKYLYSETQVGETIKIEYIRNGEVLTTDLQLDEMEKA